MNAQTNAFLKEQARTDPVKCRDCTACCRGDHAVVIRAEWGDDPDVFGHDNLSRERYHGEWSVTLARKENGDCVFLTDARCSIYDRRPAACRAFDCRRIVKALSPDQRREAVERGLYAQDIIDAGVRRMHTLKLLPVERRCFEVEPDGLTEYGRFILSR
jgi:Fe-S-cluster containining protein